ncbi:MAG: glycosyl transferase [Sphingobacteriaceae bacterium]|nr:MAG: glycosyl transferase [Sphingobacteriaceae bacterium]
MGLPATKALACAAGSPIRVIKVIIQTRLNLMNVVFTICSNNYLAHAATLIQGWFQYHPDTIGYVILVDELNTLVDYSIVSPATVVEVDKIGIANLADLVEKFNITELNTTIKPDAFFYLFEKHRGSKIIYLDPDIMVTGPFDEVFNALEKDEFVLTPHICTPVDDDKAPTDYHTLRGGVFNLGFIGLRDTPQIHRFLHWWRDRVYKYGYCDLPNNMFYDQLWTNYIPTLFENYAILKHPGYNMANWNLHERKLSQSPDGKWLVNDDYRLKFFHFSGYKFSNPDGIRFYHSRYDFISRPDLKLLFTEYQQALSNNGVSFLKTIPCVYFEQHKVIKKQKQLAAERAMPYKARMIKKLASVLRKIAHS